MENIEKLRVLDLPLNYAEGNFAISINLLDIEEALKTKKLLDSYGVTLSKESQLKFYTYNLTELKTVLARLQYCREQSIPVIDDTGQVKDFVFDAREWAKVWPNVDLNSIVPDVSRDESVLSEDMMNTLGSDIEPDLTDETYEIYSSLSILLGNVIEALNGAVAQTVEVNDNLIKLISANNGYSYRELLIGALVYGQNRSGDEISAITAAVDGVLASLDQGGSLNL